MVQFPGPLLVRGRGGWRGERICDMRWKVLWVEPWFNKQDIKPVHVPPDWMTTLFITYTHTCTHARKDTRIHTQGKKSLRWHKWQATVVGTQGEPLAREQSDHESDIVPAA